MTRPLHPDLLQPGDTVRHYRVVRRLGSGGFSTVFLVEHEGRQYTMKVAARPPSRDDESRTDERAFREAVTLGHFRHPNLPEVRELGRWPDLESGFFFVVTPYIPGCTFNVWRWKNQAPLYRLVGKLAEVARVLADSHERGVVHRDLKADNILVRDGDERPFLTDFGSAYLPGTYTLTQVLPPGTFHNMPPECAAFLIRGEWESGVRLPAHPSMDLYAFGALIYESLTDCHPFNPRLPLAELALAIEQIPPVPPVRIDPRVPLGLNDLTLRLLAKKPEQRYPSARTVHDELMRMLEAEGHTESWRVPYAFVADEEKPASVVRQPEPRIDEGPVSPRQEEKAEASPQAGRVEDTRRASRWWKSGAVALLALALGGVLLGLGWKAARAGVASTLEVACSGAVTAEKGLHPVFPSHDAANISFQPSPSGSASRLCALLCAWAAATHFAACASAHVRPDMGSILAQCPPEARATARRLNLQRIMEVELLTGTCASPVQPCPNAINIKTGPVEGVLILNGEEGLKVTGEAKVFPDRVYIFFDRVYPNRVTQENLTPEGAPVPFCGVALNDDVDRFGVTAHAALPRAQGLEIDPTRVDRSPEATILRWPIVNTYIQGPEGTFQPRR